MAETWLKYSDLANALGITPEAARQKAIRGRWRRQRGNDGKALVLVDLEAELASHVPRKRPDEHLAGRPDERRTIEALESHIATLKGDIVKGEALAEQRRGDVEAERKRRDDMVAELVPRLSDYDWLILSQSRMGKSFGATRIWMLLATPG